MRWLIAATLLMACAPPLYDGPRASQYSQDCESHGDCVLVAETCEPGCTCPTSSLRNEDAERFTNDKLDYCSTFQTSDVICACNELVAACIDGVCATCQVEAVQGQPLCSDLGVRPRT